MSSPLSSAHTCLLCAQSFSQETLREPQSSSSLGLVKVLFPSEVCAVPWDGAEGGDGGKCGEAGAEERGAEPGNRSGEEGFRLWSLFCLS